MRFFISGAAVWTKGFLRSAMILAGYLVMLICDAQSSQQSALFTQHKFRRFDERHGLTNNVVKVILQDTIGNVWVGTEEGLFRYQGTDFQVFRRFKGRPGFLNTNFIDKLYLDDKNNVWMMTDEGVYQYTYARDVISQFMPESVSGNISSMAIDEKGAYYFGQFSGGILKVEDSLAQELNLFHEPSGLDFGRISVLNMVIRDGYLWALVGVDGVIRVALETNQITYFSGAFISGVDHFRYFDIKMDPLGRVWLATAVGVYILSQDHESAEWQVNRQITALLPQEDFLSLKVDEDSVVWVGARFSGLFCLQLHAAGHYEVARHFRFDDDQRGLSAGTISAIAQDDQGYLWLGTHNGGVNVFNPDGEAVRLITRNPLDTKDRSLLISNVWGLAERPDGKLWIGTDGQGVSLLDTQTGKIENQIISEIKEAAALTILEDSQEVLWVGTYDDGLVRVTNPLKRSQRVTFFNHKNSGLTVNDIRSLHETAGGEIYIGTNQGGLFTYAADTRDLKFMDGTWNMDIRDITATQPDHLWLGTYGRGVMPYDVKNGRLGENIFAEDPERSDQVVFDLETDGRFLYIATRHRGVVVYDTQRQDFVHFQALKEVGDRLVSGVRLDNHGNLWATTDDGVWVLDPDSGALAHFGVNDGFMQGHYNFGSALRSQNGYLIFGGIHGMNLFYPDDLFYRRAPSDIVINQLRIFDHPVNPTNSSVFSKGMSIFLTDEVCLDYTDNIFSFRFSNPGFAAPASQDFIYKLEGYENEWQDGNTSNSATYRNVPPGSYTFRVKNSKDDSERTIAVVISPPIWLTWYAYLCYVGLASLLVWRLIKFNNSRVVLRQKLAFEQELREKEHEAMQEKLRFYTNFSHELKTPLTLIQGPVNDLAKRSKNKQDIKYLNLIKKNTSVILRFINRMLEFRKIEMNKVTLHVGQHDLKILAQEESESFSYLAKDKGVRFGFYCESELEAWVDLEKIQIVLNNLLSNALKFTPEGKSVHFGVYEKDEEICVEVKDEGVGIDQDELNHIFSPFYQASNSYGTGGTGIGLALSQRFIELHQGTVDVKSQKGIGTNFTIRMPKGREKFENKTYVRFIKADQEQHEQSVTYQYAADRPEDLHAKENEKLLLVVDDNKDILLYVESIFEKEYSVLKAENGKDAYDLAVNSSPDIIVSDIMMPGMDGVEFCEKIKNNVSSSHIPVIMLTAKDSRQDQVKGYQVGADGYVTKPFSSEVLVARVNNLIKNREMLELRYEQSDLITTASKTNSREVEFVLNAERICLQMLEASDLNVPALCKELGMSQSALYRKVKLLTGVSIQVFTRKIRIKKAAERLLTEDMTVSEVAFSLEFSDLKYFRKCFKEQYGLSPSEYRAEHQHAPEKLPIH